MEGDEQVQALKSAFTAITKGAKISKAVIDHRIAPKTKERLKLAAAMFNKVSMARRKIMIHNVQLQGIKGLTGGMPTFKGIPVWN